MFNSLCVEIFSFGFKYGRPKADIMFDARQLPNPFSRRDMRNLTGLDSKVSNFVIESEDGIIFIDHAMNDIACMLTKFEKEKRNKLSIAIGCMGGKHRSVAVANAIASNIKIRQLNFNIWHRDINK